MTAIIRTAECLECGASVECKFDGSSGEWFIVSHPSKGRRVCSGSYLKVRGRITETTPAPEATP
jgi:hypothetical protein